MWSLSQLQPIRVVVLYLFFSRLSRVFAIKICTAIIKEKPGARLLEIFEVHFIYSFNINIKRRMVVIALSEV